MSARELNAASLALIEEFGNLRLEAYQDDAGIWTIGYGHTSAAGDPHVVEGMTMSEEYADEILRRDVAKASTAVTSVVTAPLNDNQFGALVSFVFNVGIPAFRMSSILICVNLQRFEEVPGRLLLWNRAGGNIVLGLTRRRKSEGQLFMTPVVVTA